MTRRSESKIKLKCIVNVVEVNTVADYETTFCHLSHSCERCFAGLILVEGKGICYICQGLRIPSENSILETVLQLHQRGVGKFQEHGATYFESGVKVFDGISNLLCADNVREGLPKKSGNKS